jgi:hypothetical protein
MNEEQKELFFDLLTKKVTYGLDVSEEQQLAELDPGTLEYELNTLEMTAAAIGMTGVDELQPMPSHLRSQIVASAATHFDEQSDKQASAVSRLDSVAPRPASRPWFGWLGWAVAAVACAALGFQVATTRLVQAPISATATPLPTAAPPTPSVAEMREQLVASTSSMVRASWAPGNMKDLKELSGDVVWSDEKQAGYMRFRGLPVNDAATTTYQLWIFDQTQDKATPIDGGTFDVNSDGEVIVPINAKLKAVKPEMFAITLEKAGGVVVSKREKIAALAKVETQTS